MKAKFEVEAQEERRLYAKPGTIDVYKVEKIEFITADNGNEYFDILFGNPSEQVSHRFYVTKEANQKRFKTLYDAVVGENLVPDEKVICAKMLNKKVALKITGQINEEKGRGYNDIPFFDFCKKEHDVSLLVFNKKDQASIDLALAAQARTAAADKAAKENGEESGGDSTPQDSDF